MLMYTVAPTAVWSFHTCFWSSIIVLTTLVASATVCCNCNRWSYTCTTKDRVCVCVCVHVCVSVRVCVCVCVCQVYSRRNRCIQRGTQNLCRMISRSTHLSLAGFCYIRMYTYMYMTHVGSHTQCHYICITLCSLPSYVHRMLKASVNGISPGLILNKTAGIWGTAHGSHVRIFL